MSIILGAHFVSGSSMAGPGEHLEEVNKHIAAFKVRVANQEAQVEELERDHHPAEAAKRQLERLRRALRRPSYSAI